MTYWDDHIANAERMISFARSQMSPGVIGAVPISMTTELEEVPLEALGERPVIHYDDRHRKMEEDFNALVALELTAGRVDEETAMRANANFHDYARATNLFPRPYQTSPRFFD